ncbi:MAG: ATP-grasp domain-containing protein [Deltaproteobacteria bacterium]|nr:ATP-grasp domain-containing protein [Deltaproteobacteria bacterium]
MNAAITGLNAGDTPGPGVPVARCIREHPECQGRIIGLAYDALEPGVLDNQLIDSAYLMPYPRAGKDALLERIQYIHAKEQLDVIIPTLDSELLNFIYIRNNLSEMGIKTILPTEEQFVKRSKINLHKLQHEFGIKTPETHLITDINKILLPKEDFPIVVKGIFYEAYMAYSNDEAVHYALKIVNKWGYPVLMQKYIEGEEFNAAVIGDGEGNTMGIVCMKKIVLTDKGKGWACVSIKNHGLMDLTQKVVSSLKWRGALEVEAIYSKKEEGFYLIEINPRFPAWIYLAKAAGINLPYMLLQTALDKGAGLRNGDPPVSTYKTGVVFSNYTVNLITDLTSIQTLFTTGEIVYEKTV